jgi:hypothetical protein
MQKLHAIAICFLFAATANAFAADVYIVAGQSNGWRLGYNADYPGRKDDKKVYYFGMACGARTPPAKLTVINSLHPGVYGYGLADSLRKQTDNEIIILQFCVCGTSINAPVNWYPGDDPAAGKVNDKGLYGSFLNYYADAKRQAEAQELTWNVQGLFWHQGESDSNAPYAADYQRNLANLIVRFRNDLGADLPIIVGHIRQLNESTATINAAIDDIAAADSRVAAVASNDLTFESPTDVHFNLPGCHALGKRLAEAYIELTGKSD